MDSLIAFNKPYGVICQFSDHDCHPTLKNYIDIPEYYPAGRLDTDSEGLLLLTNNGKLQAKITSPKFKLPKTYLAQVEGLLTPEAINRLRKGVKLKEFTTLPATAKIINEPLTIWQRNPPIRQRKNIPTSWLSITIIEGKNRQVRRMCAAVGFPCLRLIREQIGQYSILEQQIEPGQWKTIAEKDLIK